MPGLDMIIFFKLFVLCSHISHLFIHAPTYTRLNLELEINRMVFQLPPHSLTLSLVSQPGERVVCVSMFKAVSLNLNSRISNLEVKSVSI